MVLIYSVPLEYTKNGRTVALSMDFISWNGFVFEVLECYSFGILLVCMVSVFTVINASFFMHPIQVDWGRSEDTVLILPVKFDWYLLHMYVFKWDVHGNHVCVELSSYVEHVYSYSMFEY
jgi:hypothetical protein